MPPANASTITADLTRRPRCSRPPRSASPPA
jgi:hypothetical protein